MSKKDGKATLLGGENKKGFHTVRVDNEEFDENKRAAEACPVNIIKVKMI
jgi:ferredoxin